MSSIFRLISRRYLSSQVVGRKPSHIPVMVNEVIDHLKLENEQTILDMTFGDGGHSEKILRASENAKIIALDRDPLAFSRAENLATYYPGRLIPLLGRFSELPKLLSGINVRQNSIDGVLFDFGCSSMQFDIASRGFALSKNGPLDMRMDGSRFPNMPTAADLLGTATEEDLYKIIKVYGEEKHARKIARGIVEARYLFKKLTTTGELAELIESVCNDEFRTDKLQRPSHVATKTFQALRIFINNELNEINYGLVLAHKYLKLGGRLVTISFHSLEDTIVKRHLSGNVIENSASLLPQKYLNHTVTIDKTVVEELKQSNWQMLHRHVIEPSFEEVESNPRSRSAKLRAAVRIR